MLIKKGALADESLKRCLINTLSKARQRGAEKGEEPPQLPPEHQDMSLNMDTPGGLQPWVTCARRWQEMGTRLPTCYPALCEVSSTLTPKNITQIKRQLTFPALLHPVVVVECHGIARYERGHRSKAPCRTKLLCLCWTRVTSSLG